MIRTGTRASSRKQSVITNVRVFLNRLFGVQLGVQKKIFSGFLYALDQIIASAKLDGKNLGCLHNNIRWRTKN